MDGGPGDVEWPQESCSSDTRRSGAPKGEKVNAFTPGIGVGVGSMFVVFMPHASGRGGLGAVILGDRLGGGRVTARFSPASFSPACWSEVLGVLGSTKDTPAALPCAVFNGGAVVAVI